MELTLAPNPLYQDHQTISFDKIATLIGENGSGKSCILYSVFDTKLKKDDFEQLRIVCFSSGQNENFSQRFSKYLTSERRVGQSLNLDCFYYDKSWSKLLIFLATCLYSDGRVRQFLRDGDYVDEERISDNNSDDITSKLKIKFKIDGKYAKRVQSALEDESSGQTDTLRATPYFRSLTSFIETNIDAEYDFEKALRKKTVTLTSSTLFAASYSSARPVQEEEDGEQQVPLLTDNPTVSFFTQAADNDYFLDKSNLKLELKGGLELDQLSDGEYQLLFLYALIDLFDSDNTLFLLDEADSHLHYQNIERLWKVLASIQGKVITTTHLLDSITANEFNSLKVVEKGKISERDKLKQLINRLHVLSRAKSVEFEVCAKIENMALLDDCNDWEIFVRLAKQKGLDVNKISSVYSIKKASSFGATSESFGKAKLQWTENLSGVECDLVTSQIFLICDRDELAPADFDKNNGVQLCGAKYKKTIKAIKWPKKAKVAVHLLAWKRREIKNYLLSFSALSHHNVLGTINNDTLAAAYHLKENDPGDNDDIRKLQVKSAVNPFINREGYGLCSEKLQAYIDLIPPEEISEDIENMYNFIVSKI